MPSSSRARAAPFDAYERQRRRLVRIPNLFARTMLALASRPVLGRRAVLNLSRQPATFARLAAINGGEAPLSSLRPRDLLALATGPLDDEGDEARLVAEVLSIARQLEEQSLLLTHPHGEQRRIEDAWRQRATCRRPNAAGKAASSSATML